MATKTEQDITLGNPDVVTKYKTASDIVSKTLKAIIEKCTPGANIMELCIFGDNLINESLKTVYVKSKVKKGIATPTSISVNSFVSNFSPLSGEPEAQTTLAKGDVAKIELGAQIDGFAAIVCHTVVVGATHQAPVVGKVADAMKAAHLASEACLRMFKAGKKSNQVSSIVKSISESHGCQPLEGMTSFEIAKDVLYGEKTVIINPSEEQKKGVSSFEFQEGEAYVVNVVVTTGEGKSKLADVKTSIFRKTKIQYQLKMKASRAFFSEVKNTYGDFGFNLRSFEDLQKARMGLHECLSHQVIEPFETRVSKDGEIVVSYSFTTLLMKNGPLKITGLDWDDALVKGEKKIDDEEIQALLNEEVRTKKPKKSKK